MPRRRPTRTKPSEPAIITQANPTKEQRGRAEYVETSVPNPAGAVVTISTKRIDGQPVTERVIHQHKVCRRQPSYVTLHNQGLLTQEERRVLDWYDDRLALARKGLTVDSLARANGLGGGNGDHTPTDAAVEARSDIRWARAHIVAGLVVFDQVMEEELSLSQIAGGGGAGKIRARRSFKEAAGWLTKGVAWRVLAN